MSSQAACISTLTELDPNNILASYPRRPQQAGLMFPAQHIRNLASYPRVPQHAGLIPLLETMLPPQHTGILRRTRASHNTRDLNPSWRLCYHHSTSGILRRTRASRNTRDLNPSWRLCYHHSTSGILRRIRASRNTRDLNPIWKLCYHHNTSGILRRTRASHNTRDLNLSWRLCHHHSTFEILRRIRASRNTRDKGHRSTHHSTIAAHIKPRIIQSSTSTVCISTSTDLCCVTCT